MLLGSRPGGAAISSVTKSGFPPVASKSSAASRPEPTASAATASSLSGASASWATWGPRVAPSSRRSGWARPTSSPRYVRTTTTGSSRTRAGELADHVERRVVGPVEVLDHDDAPALRPDGRQDPGQVGPAEVVREVLPAVVREPVDEVADGAERPRRREVVAARDHDRGAVGGLVGEAADERRLPDPGLAGHAHQPTRAAPRRAEGARQLRQRLVALEEGERLDVVERRWRAHLAPPVASPLVHRHDHPVAAAVGRRDRPPGASRRRRRHGGRP